MPLTTTTPAITEEDGSILLLIQDKNIEDEFGCHIWEEIISCDNTQALSDLLVLISIRLRALNQK